MYEREIKVCKYGSKLNTFISGSQLIKVLIAVCSTSTRALTQLSTSIKKLLDVASIVSDIWWY